MTKSLITASVIVPLPVDQVYTYRVPPELEDSAQSGARVVVPFGPRTLTGMITERTAEEGDFKPLLDVLDEAPAFSPELLQLTRWIARYYLCSWGLVMKAALPGGIEVESQRRVERTGAPYRSGEFDEVDRQILSMLDGSVDALPVRTLSRKLGGYLPAYRLRKLEQIGLLRISSEIVPPEVKKQFEPYVKLAADTVINQALTTLRGEKQKEIVRYLADGHGADGVRQADLLKQTGASHGTLASLVDRNLVVVEPREVIRTPLGDLPIATGPPAAHNFHAGQRRAFLAIGEGVEKQAFRTFLLHGVTGSGKTEVYIHALKQALDRGRTGIVLVPEIALTPQTVQRFRAHFGDRIAVLHSRMSAGERYDTWRHLRDGRYAVVIGPRSAVLAPLDNVGLIVVDEEHEASYKQFDPAPRYHARDVAVMRASMNDAVCILGSATPSLESFSNAESGKYELITMPDRVPVSGYEAAPLPEVDIVDLALERRRKQLDGILSARLRDAIRGRLDRSEQVILLQNRRGYTPVLECASCGWTQECRDCAVTLTYHKVRNHLRCHYCGRTERVPPACPSCGVIDLVFLGAGTQKVEEEVAAAFPEARLLRMDQDTTARKDAHRKILERFGNGDADILLGTQMIAKGLDFSRVTLVGVINADTGLLLPDFRSSERTFQLLTQVAGRAGRGDIKGEVIIQTRNPDHMAIQCAIRHDYYRFAHEELRERRRFLYPPYGRIVAIEFRGTELTHLYSFAGTWTRDLVRRIPNASLMGPEAPAIHRIKRHHRLQTIIKLTPGQADVVKQAIYRTMKDNAPPKHLRVNVDVDPAALF